MLTSHRETRPVWPACRGKLAKLWHLGRLSCHGRAQILGPLCSTAHLATITQIIHTFRINRNTTVCQPLKLPGAIDSLTPPIRRCIITASTQPWAVPPPITAIYSASHCYSRTLERSKNSRRRSACGKSCMAQHYIAAHLKQSGYVQGCANELWPQQIFRTLLIWS